MGQSRTSHGLGAEIGELMPSQERYGGSLLRRSVPTLGGSTSGGRERWLKCRPSPSHVLGLLVPRAGADSEKTSGWTYLALGSPQILFIFRTVKPVLGPTEPPFIDTGGSLLRDKAAEA